MAALFKVKDIAERFATSQHTVGIWIANGELQAINISRKPNGKPIWRITPEALEAFERSRTPATPDPKPQRRRRRKSSVVEFYS